VGRSIKLQTVEFGEILNINGVTVSLHPAGHILGSAQVRVEIEGEIWVVTGDYKFGEFAVGDREMFEPVQCHTLISECTFGLPIYRWEPTQNIAEQVNLWWKENQASGFFSIIGAYSLGKAQKVLSLLDPSIGPIYCHKDVAVFNHVYKEQRVSLPDAHVASRQNVVSHGAGVVIAPPQIVNSVWRSNFGPAKTSFASGWMALKSACARRKVDKGFVLSDHSDWGGLIDTVKETKAETVLFYHGKSDAISKYLTKHLGVNAKGLDGDGKPTPAQPAQQLTFL
jgi:putative mRNA 3-end processing factor